MREPLIFVVLLHLTFLAKAWVQRLGSNTHPVPVHLRRKVDLYVVSSRIYTSPARSVVRSGVLALKVSMNASEDTGERSMLTGEDKGGNEEGGERESREDGNTYEQILNKNTVPRLKEILRDKNLKVSGTKKELIARIMDSIEIVEEKTLKESIKSDALGEDEGGKSDEIDVDMENVKLNPFDFDEFDELEAFMEDGGQNLDRSQLLQPMKKENQKGMSASGGGSFNQVSFDEIQSLINLRAAARKSVDFATADRIKNQLDEEYGVKIFDSLGKWKSDTGMSGRLSEAEDEHFASSTSCKYTEKEVQALVDNRTIARRNRNFQLADEIRQDLTMGGVELDDIQNTWKSLDGQFSGLQSNDFGRSKVFRSECNLSQEEAQELINRRSDAREDGDFDTADALKVRKYSNRHICIV